MKRDDFPIRATHVAGVQHHNPERCKVLVSGERLTLRREPTNPHDGNAVEILSNGVKLGYIPRTEAIFLAKMMDHGFPFYAKVVDSDTTYDFTQVNISVWVPAWPMAEDV